MLMNNLRRGRRRLCLVFCLLILGVSVWCLPSKAWADSVADKSGGQIYTIINTVKLENRSTRSIYNINLEVPLSNVNGVEWQEVLGEEFSPAPREITVDSDGRRVGHYTISELKSGETLDLIQRVAVRNYCISYDVSEMTTADLPEEAAEYLQATADINCNSAPIKEFAAQNAEATANPYLKARLLFAAVNGYMTYDNSVQTSHSAMTAFYRKSGNCEDYANLYAALLRAEGIPAKVVTGYLYGLEAQHDNSYVSASGHINADKMRHSWVLFYINGVGWLPADPTFSYTASGEDGVVDWSRFAQITDDNRLVYTGNYLPNNDRISYDYQGAAPLISYNSELALYSLISPFRDIVDHWAAESVLGLYYHQPPLVTGLTDGYFGVNEALTRAELVTLLNRVLDGAQTENYNVTGAVWYTDLPREHWAYEEIMKAEARGIIGGYPDGTVRPNVPVTRAEAAMMMARVVGCVADDTVELPYTDIVNYGWARGAIGGLYHTGLMRGVSVQGFAPNRTMTRGEGVAVIYRWLKSDIYRQAYLDY